MPTLIIRGADGSEKKAELSGELTVGREAGNDLVLVDKGVSRRHCRFWLGEDGAAYVEDLGSANGVLVGGRRIEGPTVLRAGVEILVGGASVQLEQARAPARKDGGPQRPVAPTGALVKRGGASPPMLRHGGPGKATRMMTAKEAPARGAKQAVTKSAAHGQPRLKGQGVLSGVVFELEGVTMLVGRVAPADIVIDDDSVSRKHAEIVRAGGGATLRDLGSANGTFLNGERITEAPLSPGDVIRFGVMELVYGGPAGRAGGRFDRKKLLLFGGGALAVVLLVVVLMLAEHGGEGPAISRSPQAQAPTTSAPAGPRDPLRELSRCKALSDPENEELNWKKAIEVCGSVLKLDQTLTEARELERRARREVGFEDLLREAKTKLSTSQEEPALGLLVKIPTDSTSFNEARVAFKEATERLSKRARSACKTDFAAAAYSSAVEKCQRALEVTCNRAEGIDPEARRLFEQAAKAAGVRPRFVCPPEYKAFEPNQAGSLAPDDAERQIRAQYRDEPISELMVKYFNFGRPKQVAEEFKRLRSKSGRRYPKIDDYIVQLELIDGRYTSGQEGLRQSQPNLAWDLWKEAFEADGKLMPVGLRSFMIRDMSAQLAALYHKLGADQYRMGRYSQAARFIFEGYKLDKSNTEIITLMANWEVLSKRMLDADQSCENAQVAIDVTLPESSIHKKAEQLRKDQGCP
jgi:pSer/pThr/pTyr-binding forkhead associated (FHA) protein